MVRIPPLSAKSVQLSGYSAAWLAHLVWDQGVAGSNPATPTNFDLKLRLINIQDVRKSGFFCFSRSNALKY